MSTISGIRNNDLFKQDYPKVTIESITPEMAKKYLETNSQRQRRLRKKLVSQYASDMSRGRWELNMTPIRFDLSGKLIDGQHRLEGCILAGVPFTTAVARNLNSEVISTIDTSGTRTPGDMLQVRGVPNGNHISAAARLLLTYERYTRGEVALFTEFVGSYSKPELVDFAIQRYEELYPAQVATSAKALKSLISPAWGVFLYTIFARKDATLAKAFFETLATGENLHADDPIYRLRQRLLEMGSQRNRYAQMTNILAFTIKTWNLVRTGQKAKQVLVYKPGANEAFPKAV